MLVQDEVDAAKPVEVVWSMHTKATATANGDHATLTQGGATLQARLLEPAGARFVVEDVHIPRAAASVARRAQIDGAPTRQSRLNAYRSIVDTGTEAALPDVVPLDGWGATTH